MPTQSQAPQGVSKPPTQSSTSGDSGSFSSKGRALLATLGPGLITGASDDDPSGIGTYSQVGAQFGYGMLWTMVISYPLMAAIQEISARVGRVTGMGLSANLRKHYPKALLYSVVFLMLIGNILNLGADIGAMGASAQLLLPGKAWIYVSVFGIASLLLQIYVPYTRYASYLKWLTLSLFAYIVTAFLVHLSWRQALHATIFPPIRWNREYLTALIAVLGTTISPYLFFWQASQEVEEVECNDGEEPLKKSPEQAEQQLRRIRIDTYLGMALSNVVAFFIILTSAATLHEHGKTQIATAAQAAEALVPLAGHWAAALFACGIIGTGLLAIPILAGSAAYAMGESCDWRSSLEASPRQASRFYSAIAVATLLGVIFNFFRVDPIRALFWAAVVNGILAAPVMAVIVHMASSRRVMGKFVVPSYLKYFGWTATAVMAAACIGVFVTWK